MKIFLNFLIAGLVLIIACDVENNAMSKQLNYSISIYSSVILLCVVLLRIKHKEFKDFITKYDA